MSEKPQKYSLLVQHFKLIIFCKASPTKHPSVLTQFNPHSAFSSHSELNHITWGGEMGC